MEKIRDKRIDSVKRVIRKKFKSNVLKGLLKIKSISLNTGDHTFILLYKDKEVIIKTVPTWHVNDEAGLSPLDLLDDYTRYNDLQNIKIEQTKNVTVFDKAVTGNYLGAGKFNFFLNQKGIQYCELNFKNEKTRFKIKANRLYNDDIIRTFLIPDKKTTILYSDKEQFKLSL